MPAKINSPGGMEGRGTMNQAAPNMDFVATAAARVRPVPWVCGQLVGNIRSMWQCGNAKHEAEEKQREHHPGTSRKQNCRNKQAKQNLDHPAALTLPAFA
jgi:hypothetical protein